MNRSKRIYHYGIKRNKTITVKISKASIAVKVEKGIEITDIYSALAFILDDNNLMRVSGYKTKKEKSYLYSFHSRISMMGGDFYPLKNREEVILLALYLQTLKIAYKNYPNIRILLNCLAKHEEYYVMTNYLSSIASTYNKAVKVTEFFKLNIWDR